MVTMMAAPSTGPSKVPMPPSRVISTTSPDICQRHIGQRGETEGDRLGRTSQSGERTRQHEGEQLVAIDVVTQGQGTSFVLADGLEHLTKRRMDDAIDQGKGRDKDRHHHVIHAHVAGEIHQTQQFAARNALYAVFGIGKGRLDPDEIDHLCQRQGDHGKV